MESFVLSGNSDHQEVDARRHKMITARAYRHDEKRKSWMETSHAIGFGWGNNSWRTQISSKSSGVISLDLGERKKPKGERKA
eukprot:4852067-Pleurochrysis_carterae.AAC.1